MRRYGALLADSPAFVLPVPHAKLIQTDPNFANYRYDAAARHLILLDFGAGHIDLAARMRTA